MQVSKVHKNILEKLKLSTEEKKVEKIYNKYRENIVLLDNLKKYFPDFFNEHTEEELDDFNNFLETAMFNNFINKIKKNALKKSCHKYLGDNDVIKVLHGAFKEGNHKLTIEKIKKNIISQDKITYASAFKEKLVNALKENLITLEYIKERLLESNKMTATPTEFKKVNEDIYIITGTKYNTHLLKELTPVNYCINQSQETLNNYVSNTPYFIIFNFNVNIEISDSIFMVMMQKLSNFDVYLDIYDKNNLKVSNRNKVISINNLIMGKNKNPKDVYIDNIFKYYDVKETKNYSHLSKEKLVLYIKTRAWALSIMEMEMDNDNYELYYNKSKNLNNFHDHLEMYNIRHIEWNIDNIEYNQKSQEYLKNFSNTIIKMNESQKQEILRKIRNKYEALLSDNEDVGFNRLSTVLDFLIKDPFIEKLLIESFKDSILDMVIYHPITFIKRLNMVTHFDEKEKLKYNKELKTKIKNTKEFSDAFLIINELLELDVCQKELDQIIIYLLDKFSNKETIVLSEYLSIEKKTELINNMKERIANQNEENQLIESIADDNSNENVIKLSEVTTDDNMFLIDAKKENETNKDSLEIIGSLENILAN